MNTFLKPKNKYYGAFTNYTAVIALYIATCVVAFTFFIMDDEAPKLIFIVIKSLLWPVAMMMSMLGLV